MTPNNRPTSPKLGDEPMSERDALAALLHELTKWDVIDGLGGYEGVRPDYELTADRLIAAGVRVVTVERLAAAAQNHETSGIHGPLHCSLACGASLLAALVAEP